MFKPLHRQKQLMQGSRGTAGSWQHGGGCRCVSWVGEGHPTPSKWAGGVSKRGPAVLTCLDGTACRPGMQWDCAWDAAARLDFYSLVVFSLISEHWFQSVG